MTHVLDWLLLAWVLVSVLATPFVGRLVADRFGEPDSEDAATETVTSEPAEH